MKPINVLDFASLDLVGRDKEFDELWQAYQSSCVAVASAAGNRPSNVLYLSGYSGCGKSALVQHLKERVESDTTATTTNVRFVSGIFDQITGDSMTSTTPFQPIVDACNQLCQMILQQASPQELASTKESIRVALLMDDGVGGTEGVIFQLIPSLESLMAKPAGVASGEDTKNTTKSDAIHPGSRSSRLFRQNQLAQLIAQLRAFLRIVCSDAYPLVLFLDDLQRADSGSLDLIKALATDPKLRNFLLVGAYRENEVGSDLFDHLQAVTQERRIEGDNMPPVVTIQIGNLDPTSVSKLLSNLLDLSISKVQPLAFVVYERTKGNPFFVIEFLRTLCGEGILHFSTTTFQWVWEDVDSIKARTRFTDNCFDVSDLIEDRIERLPAKCSLVIKLGACLGAKFDIGMLSRVLKLVVQDCPSLIREVQEEQKDDSSNIAEMIDLEATLSQLVESELLIACGSKSYRWGHDRIQETAYECLPEGNERQRLHWIIGQMLWVELDPTDTEMLFAVVDQLNRGSLRFCNDTAIRIKLVQLNLMAGERATDLSAFHPASQYFQAGLDLLGTERWLSQNHDLSFGLYRQLSSVLFSMGDHKGTRVLIWELFDHATHLNDKIPSFFTLVATYSSEGKLQDAIQVCRELLIQLGEDPIPADKVTFRMLDKLVNRTRQTLKGLSDSDILALPTMTNKYKEAALHLLIDSSITEFLVGSVESLAYLLSQGLFIEHGVSSYTPMALVYLGAFLVLEGNLQEGHRMGMLGMKLTERFPDDFSAMACTKVWFYGLVDHWIRPLHHALNEHLATYRAALTVGDLEQSGFHLNGYYIMYFYGGMKLGPFLEDIPKFSNQLLDYGQKRALLVQLPYWQVALNLAGRSSDPLDMQNGESVDFARRIQKDNKYQLGGTATKSFLMQLAYYFGDLDLAYKMSCELDGKPTMLLHVRPPLFRVARIFFHGLIRLALAKKTKKRKYNKEAQKYILQLEKWASKGAVNCVHKLQILKAESLSIKSQKNLWKKISQEQVKDAYDVSIAAAARAGFLQDHALANELAGEHFLLQENERLLAQRYLKRAYQLYVEWQALAKSEHLKNRHSEALGSEFFGSPADVDTGVGHCSRQRYSASAAQIHRDISYAQRTSQQMADVSHATLQTR